MAIALGGRADAEQDVWRGERPRCRPKLKYSDERAPEASEGSARWAEPSVPAELSPYHQVPPAVLREHGVAEWVAL